MGFFTPLNETKTKRLKFKDSEVELLSGERHLRGRGVHATVKIRGKIYQVIGKACSLPHCFCDAYIKEVKV